MNNLKMNWRIYHWYNNQQLKTIWLDWVQLNIELNPTNQL